MALTKQQRRRANQLLAQNQKIPERHRSRAFLDNLFERRIKVARSMMPQGYQIGIASQYKDGYAKVSGNVGSPSGFRRSQEIKSLDAKTVAYLISWARRDHKIAQIAEGMCRSMGINPMEYGPYPIGSPPMGPIAVTGGYGGGNVFQTPPPSRNMVDWFWPHAAMMVAFDEMKAGKHVPETLMLR